MLSSMKSITCAVIAIALLISVGAPIAKAGNCVRAGGEGVGMLEDFAKFMAGAALKNSIKAKGLRPAGDVNMSCKLENLMTTCRATRRACK